MAPESYLPMSGPVDTSKPYVPSTIAGKTVVITGGASGLGAAMARSWAALGANIIIGDVDDAAGEKLVAELRAAADEDKSTSSGAADGPRHAYAHCDVTKWDDQVALFALAASTSPTGAIDAVVAGAGINDPGSLRIFETPLARPPGDGGPPGPPKPSLRILEINLLGTAYTAHLALFWLGRNRPTSSAVSPGKATTAAARSPDSHLVLVASVAGLCPLAGQAQYTSSKHGVVGLFRSLRGTAAHHGVRVNMLCPYFVETPIVPAAARMLLAGGGLAATGDVVDAASRLMADESIRGRALAVGPRCRVVETATKGLGVVRLGPLEEGKEEGAGVNGDGGIEVGVWDCYAEDYSGEMLEPFNRRFMGIIRAVESAKGWAGWARDMIGAIMYSFSAGLTGTSRRS